ncbi:phage major capsid protein [Eubacteriales bacterium OttesenSCG-928-A19]|nr:phage major capsid protein [Eubacteriales bacterium OttesenSCG-928-A19]
MTMKNLDTVMQEKTVVVQQISDALQSGDTDAFNASFLKFTNILQDAVLAQANGLIQASDQTVLAGRGVHTLTHQETDYYQHVIDAMRSANPQMALSGIDATVPPTVIDMVFEDIQNEHPLLSVIDFQNTGMLTRIILSTSSGVAGWGALCDEITDELSGAFVTIDLTLRKVSAFIPVCKAMLDLGPQWLDRYVRALLTEALALAIETAIVDGDGSAGPLGMTRALTGDTGGVFPRKTAITVTALDAISIGSVLNTISQGPNGKRRVVNELLMIVNPADYFTKVFPATTIRSANGLYVNDALPFPTRVIQSPAVPVGFAVFGLPRRYFFGLGTSQGGKLEYSDQYRFLEDERVYLIKLYGNGRPLDENAFVYADISGLTPAALRVEVVNADEFPTA